MTVWIKQGVIGDLQPVAQKGLGRITKLYASHGLDLYITSVREANHGYGSFHYIGYALDFRQLEVPIEAIKEALGPGWDVLKSNNGAVHAEWDPK